MLVAGLTAAAAALATAMVLSRGGETSYEVSAATGAVAMYPDGARRPVQAGDHVPAGGLIRTGPTGGVTIEETTVGADHVILLDEEKITLLPAPPSAPPAEGQPAAPAATAPAPATAAPTAAPVTLVPTIAPPAPPPAPAAVNPAPAEPLGDREPRRRPALLDADRRRSVRPVHRRAGNGGERPARGHRRAARPPG